MLKWTMLTSTSQVDGLQSSSKNNPVIIFKHSTSCSISHAALDRLERKWKSIDLSYVDPYLLDLLANREVSNYVAKIFDVQHESPQVLLLHQGKVIYNESHFGIQFDDIQESISKVHSKN